MSDQQVLVPDWARAAVAIYPYYDGAPLSYSFDGSQGEFQRGSEVLGSELFLQPIDWRWQSSQRWGRLPQNWLDLAAVNSDGQVIQISLKKDSAINLHAHLVRLESGKQFGMPVIPYATWIKLEALPQQTTEGDTYYVVWASHSGFASQDQADGVEGFIKGNLLEWVLIGEVES